MIDSVFLHIPKAAGTSVKSMLFRHYRQDYSIRVWHVASGGDVAPPEFSNYECDVDLITHVSGHISATKFRSNVDLWNDFKINGRFALAVTRDPLERLVSDYHYIRRTEGHPRADDADLSLEAFISAQPANAQARFLGISNVDVAAGNLVFEKDDALSERLILLDTSLIDVQLPVLEKAAFGESKLVERKNVASQPTKSDVRGDLLEKFHEKNQLDIELVRYAKKFGLRDIRRIFANTTPA